MKIAVCGSGREVYDKKLIEKAKIIGEEIAKNKAILYTGGCWGYPYEAAKACYEKKGKIIAVSPAKDIEDHKRLYNFPTDIFSDYIFTGLGIPERNYILVKNVDAIIIIGGQIGTLNEFTVAFHDNRIIGILKGSGGITTIIPKIVKLCGKKEKSNIIYEKDPIKLVRKIIKKLK